MITSVFRNVIAFRGWIWHIFAWYIACLAGIGMTKTLWRLRLRGDNQWLFSTLDKHDGYFTHTRLDVGTASIDVKCWWSTSNDIRSAIGTECMYAAGGRVCGCWFYSERMLASFVCINCKWIPIDVDYDIAHALNQKAPVSSSPRCESSLR